MTQWFLILSEDGTSRQVTSMEGEDVAGKTVIPLERRGDLSQEHFDPVASAWCDDMPRLRAQLLARIDLEREAAQQALLTPGTAKALVYAQKAREVDRWASMTGQDRSAADVRLFPAASAEASVTGEELGDVMTRIAAAASEINAELYRLDAIATAAKQAVRDADSGEAARSAAAAVAW